MTLPYSSFHFNPISDCPINNHIHLGITNALLDRPNNTIWCGNSIISILERNAQLTLSYAYLKSTLINSNSLYFFFFYNPRNYFTPCNKDARRTLIITL